MTKNKTIHNLTSKELSQVIRESYWNRDYLQEFLKKYLNATSFMDLLYHHETVTIVKSLAVRFCISEFLQEKKLQIEQIIELGSDGEYPATFSKIEYEQHKYKSCLSSGHIFYVDKTKNYMYYQLNRYMKL